MTKKTRPEVLLELSIKTKSKGNIHEKPLEITEHDDGSTITTKLVYFHVQEAIPLRIVPDNNNEY